MTCPKCGGTNPVGNRFCGSCGASLPSAGPAGHSPAAVVERRQLTLLFCDLVDSTALSVRLDPEDFRDIIGLYQRTCASIVARSGGFVTRLLGDGVLASFGYPSADENDAERAVRAGLALVEAVGQLRTVDGDPLQARVGIASGLVVVGAGDSPNEGIVGDTPNLAARLQALAEPGQVVVSSSTRHLLGARFDFADLGSQYLKGFAEPVRVWQATRENEVRERFEALHAGGMNAIVGRDPELAFIVDRWSKAKHGEGQVVLVSAEAGVGKSRLVHALLQRLGSETAARRLYHCSPFHRNSALHPMLEQLQHAADFWASDSPGVRLAKFTAFSERLGYTDEKRALLAYLLSLPGNELHPRQDLTPKAQMDATLAALADFVLDLARTQPVLIVVEDLHWIDPTTLALVERLTDQVRFMPVFMIATFRPEFLVKWTGGHISKVALSHLGQRDTAELLAQLTRGKQLPAAVRDQIVAKTDGIPLFVEELTKTILESGMVRDAGDRYELAVQVQTAVVPATLRDSLMARLDRLGRVKEVAQIGAAIGRNFTYELLAAVTPLPEEALNEALDQLIEAGLVFPRGLPPHGTYTFKHALVQDTAYDSMLRARRRVLHAQIARVLGDRWPEIVAEQPELLAHHHTLAGNAEEAVQLWLRAARRSAERGGPAEAIGLFEKALEVLRTCPATPGRHRQELAIRIALVTLTMSLKGYSSRDTERAIANARHLAERLGETGQIFPILYGEWVATFARGQIEASRELAEHFAILAARQPDTTPRVVAHRMLGGTLVHLGELSRGREQLERCVGLYDPAAHGAAALIYGQDSRVSALAFLSWALLIQGHPGDAIAAACRSLECASETEHAHTQAVALCLAGLITRVMMRDVAGVAELAATAIALAEQNGLSMWLQAATIADGWLQAQRGFPDQGIRQTRKGLDGLKAMGVEILRPFFLSLLAEIYAGCDEQEAGLEAIAEAIALVPKGGERLWHADLHRVEGELLMARASIGGEVAAEATLLRAVALARGQGARYWELRAATSLAGLWLRQGDAARARTLLASVYRASDDAIGLRDFQAARVMLSQL